MIEDERKRKEASNGKDIASEVRSRKTPAGQKQELIVNLGKGCSSDVTAISQARHTQEDGSVCEPRPNGEASGNVSSGSSIEYLPTGQGVNDWVDSRTGSSDIQRTKAAIEHLREKIQTAKDMIALEQKAQDENVKEYLRLANSANEQQTLSIKKVFEKKNLKSAQTIAQLQKKLANYPKRIRELEIFGIGSYRPPKEVLRDVSQGLKQVYKVLPEAWFIPKPEDGANTEESAEKNNPHNDATFTHKVKSKSDDECTSVTSGSGSTSATGTTSSIGNTILQPPNVNTSTNVPSIGVHRMTTTQSGQMVASTSTLPVPLNEVPMDSYFRRCIDKQDESMQSLQDEVDALKNQVAQDMDHINSAILEERDRCEQLEDQMNDLIELHQNDIKNLKQRISDMEEKLQYQSEERLRDIHELMERGQTRISRMEQQLHDKEQLVTFDGIENINARAILLKLINVLLTILQVILLLVATVSKILMPFIKTRFRIVTTTILIIGILMAVRQWPHWLDFGLDFIQKTF